MRTALIFSDCARHLRRWGRSLEAAGWRVMSATTLTEVVGASHRGIDVVVLDAETPRELAQLVAFHGFLDLPPMFLRVSELACSGPLSGSWRAHLHIGALDGETLQAGAALLHAADRTPPTTLPVRLPCANVTKWSVRLEARSPRWLRSSTAPPRSPGAARE